MAIYAARHARSTRVAPARPSGPSTGRVAVVIAAHDEERAIGATLRAVLAQEYPLAAVVVMADNCTDRTVEVAQAFAGVTVVETVENTEKKAGALNQAWWRYRDEVDYVACLDADTVLPPPTVGQWVRQAEAEPLTGGVAARFTVMPRVGNSAWGNLLTRLQKAEFSRWTDTSLNRGGRTSVLSGTSCLLRVSALNRVYEERVARGERPSGPWTYDSTVEDFELTYRMRRLGFDTQVSYEARAYTDAMTTLRALWAQRMKWQTGTADDLLRLGVDRYTVREWGQQAVGMLAAVMRFAWLAMMVTFALLGSLTFTPVWLLVPLVFVVSDVKHVMRVPHRDGRDVVLAALLLPQELFSWMRAAWFLTAWAEVLSSRLTGRRKDRWALQISVETA